MEAVVIFCKGHVIFEIFFTCKILPGYHVYLLNHFPGCATIVGTMTGKAIGEKDVWMSSTLSRSLERVLMVKCTRLEI